MIRYCIISILMSFKNVHRDFLKRLSKDIMERYGTSKLESLLIAYVSPIMSIVFMKKGLQSVLYHYSIKPHSQYAYSCYALWVWGIKVPYDYSDESVVS